MQNEQKPTEPVKTDKPVSQDRKHRSPSYPFLSLEESFTKAGKLFEKERRHTAPLAVVGNHWGYSAKSSGLLQSVAACKQFGLINETGSGGGRMFAISDFGVQLLNPGNPEKVKLLKEAALKPEVFSMLWGKYGGSLPSDETIKAFLVFDKSFSDEAAKVVLGNFKDTISFANLTGSDSVQDVAGESNGSEPSQIEEPSQYAQNVNTDNKFDKPQLPPQQPPLGVKSFQVPLPSGVVGAFTVPFPMTEEDYSVFSALLQAYKPGLVKKA